MKRICRLILIILILSKCQPKEIQGNKENHLIDTVYFTKSNFKSDSIDVLNQNKIVHQIINFDSIEPVFISGKGRTINLIFKEINEKDFVNFKKNYISGFYFDSSKVANKGEFFILNTASTDYKFPCQIHCYFYSGYFPFLHSFILRRVRDVSQFILLDSLTGKSYTLNSAENSSNPLFSKSGKQFIIYSSSEYDKYSSIDIYTRHNLNEQFDFQKFDSFATEDWLIRELVWIDENSFAIKIYNGVDFDSEGQDYLVNVRYLKAIIKK
jgi:hypothetical protein